MFPNNQLEVQLDQCRASGDALGPWLQELRMAAVFVPLRIVGGQSSLGVVELDGQQLVPVFTSEEMLRKVTEVPFMTPPFSELVEMLPSGVGLLVNPQSDVSITIAATDLRPVRTSDEPVAVDAARLFIGEPADEPVEVLAALSRTAHDIAAVRELRRAWVSIDGAEPGLVVGIDVDPDNDEVRVVVTSALRDALSSGEEVSLLFANDRGPVITWMWSDTEPFHVKE